MTLDGRLATLNNRLALSCRSLDEVPIANVHFDLVGVFQACWDEGNVAKGHHHTRRRLLRHHEQILPELRIRIQLLLALGDLLVQRLQVLLEQIISELRF